MLTDYVYSIDNYHPTYEMSFINYEEEPLEKCVFICQNKVLI